MTTASNASAAPAEEPALLPQQAICDPHHHLWRHKGAYEIADFLRDAQSGHDIVSTVFVACEAMYRPNGPEALRPVGETEYVEAMRRRYAMHPGGNTAVAAGIVGFADLMLGAEVEPVLEAHLAASPTSFRGIRHTTTWDPSPAIRTSAPYPRSGVMLEPAFHEGVRCLQQYQLVFDAWLFHPQLPELAVLAIGCPGVQIVLNHLGLPLGIGPYAGRRDEVFARWSQDITAIADLPNVCVKLGGLGMPRSGFGWENAATKPDSVAIAQATRPYFMHCIEHFGPDRCMFESNFPVDGISYSYRAVWNAFKRVAMDFSADERKQLFHDTAVRIYRLQEANVARSSSA